MQPRRLPWASKVELSELYELLFAPGADGASRQRGLARMSVYISSPSCPAFLHLLHTLVAASLRDSPVSAEESQSTRLAMAMAVVRFINGMVDPLQTGPYARPISHIAASLGIPPSLVALRHRATHEDLPPLPLLRQAIHQAIEYLHRYSFLPMLASSSALDSDGGPVLGRRTKVESLVRRWKSTMKLRLREREVREDSESGREISRVKRGLEAEDAEDLVQVLCAEGGLVPLARKKRPAPNALEPTKPSMLVWLPLLTHLSASNTTMPFLLADQILVTLLTPDNAAAQIGAVDEPVLGEASTVDRVTENRKERLSYRRTLATWLLWIWTGGASQHGMALNKEDKDDLWMRLLTGLINGDAVVLQLYRSLLRVDSARRALAGLETCLLVDDEDAELHGLEHESDDDVDLSEEITKMEDRLSQLEKSIRETSAATVGTGKAEDRTPAGERADLAADVELEDLATRGWKLVSEKEWKPCPIGVWAVM